MEAAFFFFFRGRREESVRGSKHADLGSQGVPKDVAMTVPWGGGRGEEESHL